MGNAKGVLADKKNAWVEDVKIAPNSKMIAFGTHGGLSKVELINVLDNGRTLQKLASVNMGISSALTHLDWSTDSNTIVLNSQGYELMWLDINSKKAMSASSSKDIDF